MEWAIAALVPFWAALFLVAKMRPARVGRLAALQILAPVQGFHFMLSYYRPRTRRATATNTATSTLTGSGSGGDENDAMDQCVDKLVRCVATALTANRCNVWLDAYRLVNGEPRHHAVRAAYALT